MKTKKCGRCKEHKSLDDFNNDKSRSDGKYPVCKACKRIYAQSARGQATRQRWVDGGGIERTKEHAKKPEVKARRNAKIKASRLEVQKRQVRTKTVCVVRAGLLHHPGACRCLGCHGQASEYHHHDYRKPLDVTALCRDCHMGLHAYMRHNGLATIAPKEYTQDGQEN